MYELSWDVSQLKSYNLYQIWPPHLTSNQLKLVLAQLNSRDNNGHLNIYKSLELCQVIPHRFKNNFDFVRNLSRMIELSWRTIFGLIGNKNFIGTTSSEYESVGIIFTYRKSASHSIFSSLWWFNQRTITQNLYIENIRHSRDVALASVLPLVFSLKQSSACY